MNKIAKFIKESRRNAGLTQKEFALRSGLGLRFIRELEQGKETVRMDKVNQALGMFGMQAVPGVKKFDSTQNVTAYVYINDIFAATLSRINEKYRFKYDKKYLQSENCIPVSPTLPLQSRSFSSKTLFPFFDELIPKGPALHDFVYEHGLDINDRFEILLVACSDSINNISISRYKN